MKIIAKLFLFLPVGLLVAAMFCVDCKAGSDSDQTKADAKAAVEKAADTAKDIVKQGKEVATNVVAKVKEGAKKAGEVVTNVAGEVKEKVKKIGD